MQLRHLSLRNIRSYASAELEFGPGTTLVAGDVGAGKTSLLFAIEMALFGFAEVDPVYLIRHHARQASVALTLEDGEHRYELRRRFSRKSRKGRDVFEPDDCSYGEDGSVRRYSPTELRQRAIDLLGFPDNPNPRAHSDLWRWAVYIPQEKMRDVLEQDADARRETVRKALGLEQYKTASDNAQLLSKEVAARARSLEDRAEGLKHHEEALPTWTARRDQAAVRLGELALARDEATRARDAAEAALRLAEETARARALDRQERERLRREAGRLEAQRSSLANLLGELERRERGVLEEVASLTRLAAQRPELEAARRALAAELDRLREEVQRGGENRRELLRLEAELGAAQERRTAAERGLREVEGELRLAEQRLEASRSVAPLAEPASPTALSLGELDAERARLQAAIERQGGELATRRHLEADTAALISSGTCPRCHQPVDPSTFRRHLTEAEASVRTAEVDLARLREELAHADAQRNARDRFERAHDAWRSAQRERELAGTAWEGARRRDAAARAAVETQRVAFQELQARLAPLRASVSVGPGPSEPGLAEAEARRERLERSLLEATRAETRSHALVDQAADLQQQRRSRGDELARTGEELAVVRLAESEIEARLAGPDDLAALEGCRGSLRAAGGRLEALGRELARVEAESAQARDRIQEAEAGLRRRVEMRQQAAEERHLAEYLHGPFRDELQRLEELRLARAQAEFGRVFARSFQTLVEDPALTARTDGTFTPAVEIDGEWTPAEALSGGERTALALAFRIALGHVVRSAGRLRLETLILDEPTDGFSPEQVLRLGELLEELALPQVLLVSHEPGLAAIADRVVRVGKSEGVSQLDDATTSTSVPAADPPERPPDLLAR